MGMGPSGNGPEWEFLRFGLGRSAGLISCTDAMTCHKISLPCHVGTTRTGRLTAVGGNGKTLAIVSLRAGDFTQNAFVLSFLPSLAAVQQHPIVNDHVTPSPPQTTTTVTTTRFHTPARTDKPFATTPGPHWRRLTACTTTYITHDAHVRACVLRA